MNNVQIDGKEFELMLEYNQIKKRTRLIGIQINIDYEGKVPVCIGVLTGSFIFMADLMKEVEIASEVSFVKIKSYEGDKTSGEIRDILGLDLDLNGRDVILVEDIIDTGLTLKYLLKKIYQTYKPASVTVCTLLYKPNAVKEEIKEIGYVGFEIPNDFVVGYGLDYNGIGRNLKDIYRAI